MRQAEGEHVVDRRVLAAIGQQSDVVRELCEAIGYGRVMKEAERLWRERELAAGRAGSIVPAIGPVAGRLVPCACTERRSEGDHDCDWCGGSGRVTERVRDSIQRLEGSADELPSQAWVEHAYPLQQITIRLQGTRHSRRADMLEQLQEIEFRLRAGDEAGELFDDDFGYSFVVQVSSDGPSFCAAAFSTR